MCVLQNWPNSEKPHPFFQFSSKLLDCFWLKDLTNHLLFPVIVSFVSILFLLGYVNWKMDALFQSPLGPISIILNFSKKNLWKLTPNKNFWEVLMKIEGIQAISVPSGQNPPPPPPQFLGLRVNYYIVIANLLEIGFLYDYREQSNGCTMW